MSDRSQTSWSEAAVGLLGAYRMGVEFVNEVASVPGWRLDGRVLPRFHVLLITRGRGRYTIAGEGFPLVEGSLVLVGPGVPHAALADPDHPPGIQSCRFGPVDERGRPVGSALFREGVVLTPPEPERYRAWFADAWRLWLGPRTAGGGAALAATVTRLFLAACADRDAAVAGAAADPRVAAVIDRLAADPAARVDLATMAAWAGMGRTRFVRAFAAAAGMSPGAFLIRLRLRRAQALLRDTDLGVAAVAEELGYPDAFAFSKQFRKEVGLPPKAWRQLVA